MSDLMRMRMVIGGSVVDAISGRTFESENPFTGRGWAVVPDADRPLRRLWRFGPGP
jgi:aldehyde dehydrogenase (NAD+)